MDRVVLVGHSPGGFFGAITTTEDDRIACFAFLAGADLGWFGLQAREDASALAGLESIIGQHMDARGGPVRGDARRVASEIVSRAEAWSVPSPAANLVTRPIFLVAAACDEVTPKTHHHERVIAALRQADAEPLTEGMLDDDHVFSVHRIELARQLTDWLRAEC